LSLALSFTNSVCDFAVRDEPVSYYNQDMSRLIQMVFVASLLATSWLLMMAFHELGHIAAAWVTGGTVQNVVLHPLAISQTDVFPNPRPLFVVWAGPIIGCVLPVALASSIPENWNAERKTVLFLTGFCLIANGCYISFGAFDRVGDCGDMLDAGTPFPFLLLFGVITIPAGLFAWHRLGSITEFFSKPELIRASYAIAMVSTLLLIVLLDLFCSRV